MNNKLRVIMVEVGEMPYIKEIENTLEAKQEIVGGYIETNNLGGGVFLVCHEEGKLIGLPPNRVVSNDIIVGTFFLSKVDFNSGEFVNFTPEEEQIIIDDFSSPVIQPNGKEITRY